jgi:hypothetical protein
MEHGQVLLVRRIKFSSMCSKPAGDYTYSSANSMIQKCRLTIGFGHVLLLSMGRGRSKVEAGIASCHHLPFDWHVNNPAFTDQFQWDLYSPTSNPQNGSGLASASLPP